MAVAGLVLGICAIVFGVIFGWTVVGAIVGIICGGLGLVFSIISKKNGEVSGKTTAGLICSVIGLALSVIILISCVACAACFTKDVNDAIESGNYNYSFDFR